MARLKLSKASSYLRYAERELAKATDDKRREFWQAKADFYRQALEGRCERCGRVLTDPDSIARRVGSECVKHVERMAS